MNSQRWYARFNSEVSYLNDVEALNWDRESTNHQYDHRSLRPPPINVFSILKKLAINTLMDENSMKNIFIKDEHSTQ